MTVEIRQNFTFVKFGWRRTLWGWELFTPSKIIEIVLHY